METAKRRRSCDSCAFYVGHPGFFRTKMVCMAPEDSDRNPAERGRRCPCFVPQQTSLNVAESLAKMTAWAERDMRTPSSRDVAEVESVEDLEIAAAQARADAARAKAEAAEAELRLAEAKLRARRRDT